MHFLQNCNPTTMQKLSRHFCHVFHLYLFASCKSMSLRRLVIDSRWIVSLFLKMSGDHSHPSPLVFPQSAAETAEETRKLPSNTFCIVHYGTQYTCSVMTTNLKRQDSRGHGGGRSLHWWSWCTFPESRGCGLLCRRPHLQFSLKGSHLLRR